MIGIICILAFVASLALLSKIVWSWKTSTPWDRELDTWMSDIEVAVHVSGIFFFLGASLASGIIWVFGS